MKEIEVFLENCKLFLKCGVYEEERKLGVEVNVSLYVKSNTFVDYQKLYDLLLEVSQGEYIYMEDFIEAVILKITSVYGKIDKIELKMFKKSLPFRNSIEKAGVRIVWER